MENKKQKRVKVIKILLILLIVVLALIPLAVDIKIGNEQRKNVDNFKTVEKKNDHLVVDVSTKDPIGVLYYFNKEMPIYINDPTMSRGATLVEGTDLLLGRKGQTSLLASHSGLSVTRLFNDLIEFKEGDTFKVKNQYGEIFEYKVFDKKLVDPGDVKSIHRFQDKNVLVLITCYPRTTYAKRLLIYGERINMDKKPEEIKAKLDEEIKISRNIETKEINKFRIIYIGVITGVVLLFILISRLKFGRNRD